MSDVKHKRSFKFIYYRAVTKISGCQVNKISRRGIKQLGISFGSIFLLISYESSRGNPQPPTLNGSPVL